MPDSADKNQYSGKKLAQSEHLLDAEQSLPWEGGPTFSLRNRLYRLIWAITWSLLASWTPSPLRAWRRWLLVRFGAQLASTANVYGSAQIWSPANLTMMEFSAIGPNAKIYSMAPISIGAYAIISQGAHLCAGTHDVESPHFQLSARPISIGDRAWIAADAFLGPGVTVGEGAVVGARACAMRDILPWTINTGNPATFLRYRNLRFE